MALNFDPSPYLEAFQYGRNIQNQNKMAPFKSAGDLGNTLGQLGQQTQDQKRQQLMNQLLKGQVNAANIQNAPLIAPGTQPNPTPTGMPDYSSASPSLMPNFQPSGGSSQPSDSGVPSPTNGGGNIGSGSLFSGVGSPIVRAHKQFLASQGVGGQASPATSQPQPMFSGSADNSDPEAPYKKILMDPTESPIRQKMAAEALSRITEEEKTPFEIPTLQAGLAKTQAETSKATAETAKANAEANMLNSPGGGWKTQNALEQQGRDLATKIINSRSGDFGIQNQKVSQAIHLRSLMDQYRQTDPNTGQVTYNIPNSQYAELSVGLANLLSNGGQAAESTIKNIQQVSAQGDLNKMLTYAGFDPTTLGGSTQSIFKNLSDSIDRQGLVSQKLREPVLNQIRQQMPTMLDPAVKERIINSLGVNKYEDFMQGGAQTLSPVGQGGGQSSGLTWQGRPLKDTPANRAWLAAQQGGSR